jgi:hypothetical protein
MDSTGTEDSIERHLYALENGTYSGYDSTQEVPSSVVSTQEVPSSVVSTQEVPSSQPAAGFDFVSPTKPSSSYDPSVVDAPNESNQDVPGAEIQRTHEADVPTISGATYSTPMLPVSITSNTLGTTSRISPTPPRTANESNKKQKLPCGKSSPPSATTSDGVASLLDADDSSTPTTTINNRRTPTMNSSLHPFRRNHKSTKNSPYELLDDHDSTNAATDGDSTKNPKDYTSATPSNGTPPAVLKYRIDALPDVSPLNAQEPFFDIDD